MTDKEIFEAGKIVGAMVREIVIQRQLLEEWIRTYGLCHTTISGSGMQVVTPEMDTKRCGDCLPCRTRELLEKTP